MVEMGEAGEMGVDSHSHSSLQKWVGTTEWDS